MRPALLLLAVGGLASAAPAAPISTVTGTFGTPQQPTGLLSVTAAPPAGPLVNLVSFSGSGANTTVVDGTPALPANTSNFTGSGVVTGVTPSGGGTRYALTGGTGTETLNFTNPAAETVLFSLNATEAFVPDNNSPTTIIISGTKTLTRDDAGGYDFGGVGRAFTFSLTLTGDVNFNTILGTDTVAVGPRLTGSFVNAAAGSGGSAVPEPLTVALFGGLVGVGGLAARRRLRG